LSDGKGNLDAKFDRQNAAELKNDPESKEEGEI
jgi:hypothetical protein